MQILLRIFVVKTIKKQKAPDASRTEGLQNSSFNHETLRSQNLQRSWVPHGLAAVLNLLNSDHFNIFGRVRTHLPIALRSRYPNLSYLE